MLCSGISTTILNYLKLKSQPLNIHPPNSKLMIETVFEKLTSGVLFTTLMLRNVLPSYNGGKSRKKIN